MAINFEKGWINVVSEEVDDEGNHHVEFELADEFVDWFMKREKLQEWSDERFHVFMVEELPALARERRAEKERSVE